MEVFSTVASAISIMALLNQCVECFEYVQLGRHFGKDFERCQLKLDVAKLRLTRWGQAVAYNENNNSNSNNNPRSHSGSQSTSDLLDDVSREQARAILEQIQDLFSTLERASKRYQIGAKDEDLARFSDDDLTPVPRKLHAQLRSIAQSRQDRTNLMTKARWALYESKQFVKLIDEIRDFLDDLEKLCPRESHRRQLVEAEIKQINDKVNDEQGLIILKEAAMEMDSVLEDVIAHRAEGPNGGKNFISRTMTDGDARVRVGNEWSGQAIAGNMSLVERTANGADTVMARGSSAVHVGNSYGGQGIFG